MELFLLIIRLLLAAVFIVAGLSKLFDLKGAEKAAREFGVPDSVAQPVSYLLPVVEVIIGVMLLFSTVSWIGALGASLLLLIFVAGMAYQLSKGNAPDCHCFGQLHSEPVGKASLLRNVFLLVLSGGLVARGQGRQGMGLQQVGPETIPMILGCITILLLVGVFAYLRKIVANQDEIVRRIELLELISRDGAEVNREEAGMPSDGLPIGAPFPDFSLPDLSGSLIRLQDLLAGNKPVLFLFVGPNCDPCGALVPDIEKWTDNLNKSLEIVLVSSGSVKENLDKFGGDKEILIEDERAVAISAGAKWTPTALLVNLDGRIASHLAAGDIAIHALVEKIEQTDLSQAFVYFTHDHDHGRGTKIGESIPEFVLADLNGREVGTDHLKGKSTLVTFWSPTCPHCAKMAEELRKWEGERRNGDPNLIVFSDGDVDEHKALGLESPVLIDKGYVTAGKFGMFGSPSAVLVNEDGIIITETAVGAQNIWSLIGRY